MGKTLTALFSEVTATYEIRNAVLDDSYLWPEEEKILQDVSEKRRWDFVSGRKCARLAIETLGVKATPVLTGLRDEPIWPDGLVGSITHTRNYAAAAIAPASKILCLGLDAEPDEPLPHKVLSRISNAEEFNWVQRAKGKEIPHPGTLLFSAKEATYKAWNSVTKEWLGFSDAHVNFHIEKQTFTVSLNKPSSLKTLSGTFGTTEGIIMTAIEIPVSQ
ncbi:MAG: 4'-phosphopantetheinyl transferase [Acidimicrobiaceae bacterium]|nr:4'-phosphopantetheinyl transferase [Acidimicrobiaceae bacterium]|tara:strand:+ start:2455 stop:3108 length:654 start_codon:yes stop_codon:yes gene_type:complete